LVPLVIDAQVVIALILLEYAIDEVVENDTHKQLQPLPRVLRILRFAEEFALSREQLGGYVAKGPNVVA